MPAAAAVLCPRLGNIKISGTLGVIEAEGVEMGPMWV